jgi:hypothetical protein
VKMNDCVVVPPAPQLAQSQSAPLLQSRYDYMTGSNPVSSLVSVLNAAFR